METRPLFRGSLRTPCTSTSRSVYHLRFDLIAKCPLKEDRNKNRYCESRDGHNPRCDSCPPFLGLHYCGNQCNKGAKTTYCSKVKYKNLGEAFASSDDIHIYQCEDSCKNSHECQDVGIHMLFNIPNLIGLLVNHLNFICINVFVSTQTPVVEFVGEATFVRVLNVTFNCFKNKWAIPSLVLKVIWSLLIFVTRKNTLV